MKTPAAPAADKNIEEFDTMAPLDTGSPLSLEQIHAKR
jgi:hypothetical protein